MWPTKLGASLVPLCLGAGILGIPSPSGPSAFPIVRESPGRIPTPSVDPGQATPPQTRLFASDEPVELTLEANWDRLKDDRSQESEERPGRVHWKNEEAREIAIPIHVRTRGTFRLMRRTCSFPPIRLTFPSTGTEGTIFEGQDKVKVVTHCRDRDEYEQNVLEEYLAYRIYNLLTDISFRVRLARITYVDSRERDEPVTRMAFLIEDEDAMAARLDGTMVEVPSAPPSDFSQEQAALMYVFQFMIGNTDWAISQFHNVKAMRIGGDYFPVPYDFDWSGLVDAPYAGPNPKIADRIENVRERLFWGACNDAIDYQALFARLRGKREAILALPQSIPGLSERNQRSAVEYLQGFYEVIDSENAARRQIVNACRRFDVSASGTSPVTVIPPGRLLSGFRESDGTMRPFRELLSDGRGEHRAAGGARGTCRGSALGADELFEWRVTSKRLQVHVPVEPDPETDAFCEGPAEEGYSLVPVSEDRLDSGTPEGVGPTLEWLVQGPQAPVHVPGRGLIPEASRGDPPETQGGEPRSGFHPRS